MGQKMRRGALAGVVGAARLAPNGWLVLLRGLLIAIAVVTGYALASRIWPADIAPNDLYSRLAQPYGYWNALGLTAAMGVQNFKQHFMT